VEYDLTAMTLPEQTIRVGAGEFKAVRIDLRGWTSRPSINRISDVVVVAYEGTVWYVPDLNRVVRFNVLVRTGSKGVWVEEQLELTGAGRG
jgi:serine protease Do